MIRSIVYFADGSSRRDLPLANLAQALTDPNNLIWISLEQTNPSEQASVLNDLFHFHPLAIEDCQSTGYQPPKVDDFSDYIFMIVHAIKPDGEIGELDTMELNLFLGSNYLVTSYLEAEMPPVADVWKRLDKDERLHTRGADFLCHTVLDELVDDYMPVLDRMDDEIEYLEDMVVSKPNPQTLERMMALKHSVMTLRRIVSPMREVINRLSRDEFAQIDRQSMIYFRDIYDHLVRIQDLSESVRDIVSGSLDIYLNSTSLRLNEIMKALTIVSTIFLPLSFVAGMYGMNFKYMPELGWKFGYLMVWGIFIAIGLGMLTYFKKKNWF